MAIGAQQVALAQTHTEVARQEELISRTQLEHAQATVEFLAHKFTNAELYAWMSGVLGGAYNYFLQQATAMAQQAQHQLAFERQESPPAFIKADYWEATEDAGQPAGGQNTPDRQGLTGSVRLLQDITRLDQFAFDTNRRKLQLAQTFSLARLFPAEFQRFRETGVLPFATPMALFDQRFPGHYLRTVKRARVSVVALVPPDRGLSATLIGSGISRVVTGGDVFSDHHGASRPRADRLHRHQQRHRAARARTGRRDAGCPSRAWVSTPTGSCSCPRPPIRSTSAASPTCCSRWSTPRCRTSPTGDRSSSSWTTG